MRAALRLSLLIAPLGALPFACSLDAAGVDPSGGVAGPGSTGAGGMIVQAASSGAGGSGGAGGAGGMGGAAGMADPACGDTILNPSEQCDDGNLEDGDGCSIECIIEPGETCPGSKVMLSPAGLTVTGDTAAASHDAVSIGCATAGSAARDYVYAVVPQVGGTLVATLSSAFTKSLYVRRECNGLKEPYELTCDVGLGLAGIQLWVFPGVTYYIFVDGQAAGDEGPFALDLRLYPCGDGVVQGLEQCDDPADSSCIGCLACAGPKEYLSPASRHCYYLEGDTEVSWYQARRECVVRGGDLATIGSWAERGLVDFLTTEDTWVGANDIVTEGAYTWATGAPFRFADWASGQPDSSGDEDCAHVTSNGEMNDNNCANDDAFLCERIPTGGCGDGIAQGIEECDDGNSVDADGCSKCVVDCAQGEFKDAGSRHCYRVVTGETKNFDDAAADCATWGGAPGLGHLVSIQSLPEQDFINNLISQPAYLGATDAATEATFLWPNDEPLIYSAWAQNEPNNANGTEHCAIMLGNGPWNDSECDVLRPYVCERDAAGTD
jgi:cysteine-rich repeat protein